MALIAHQVMVEAERKFRRADALVVEMEPHLLKHYRNSAIYSYTTDRDDRTTPPGDVLLAAALAAGISLDEKLGMARQQTGSERDIEQLRSEIAAMRDEIAGLRGEPAGHGGAPAEQVAAIAETDAERLAAQRRAWARQSQ